MDFFKFLSQFSKVESATSLIAFLIAAILGYFLSRNNSKLKNIHKIIQSANTKTKADLASELMEVFPTGKIPELSQKQGFEVLKLNLEHKATEYKSKVQLLRICTILLFLLIVALIGRSYISYRSAGPDVKTSGSHSPVIIGNGNVITNEDSTLNR